MKTYFGAVAITLLGSLSSHAFAAECSPNYFLSQDQEPTEAAPIEEDLSGLSLFDFERLDLNLQMGFLAFGSDFEADPEFGGGFLLRAPMPWLSRNVLGFETDVFGAFVQLTLSEMERDFEPELEHPSDSLVFVGAGLDYALYEDEYFLAALQLGVQYGYFGDVTDTTDGFAALPGLLLEVRLGGGFSASFNPQLALADAGNRIGFIQFGVGVKF